MAIEVGSVMEGVVNGITDFGAFIDLPEKKVGLVHISEVADEYVKNVKDFLKEKDKVKVKVLSIDANGKIGLSIKQLQTKKPVEENQAVASRNSVSNAQRTDGDAQRASFRRNSFKPVSGSDFRRSGGAKLAPGSASFEDKISKFMKDSEEILRDSSRRTDSKRGGRGGRRK